MLLNVEGFMEEYGFGAEVVKSAEFKDMGSPFRSATPEEIAIFQRIVDESHEYFIRDVAKNRGIDVDEVRKVADGRPFTGRYAKEVGLVDELGNLDDAVGIAAKLGGISGMPETIVLETRKPLLPSIFSRTFERVGYGIGSAISQRAKVGGMEIIQ